MGMNDKRCDHCHTGAALRRYCRTCSPKASAIYKRHERRQAKAVGEHYWLEWWVKTYGDDAIPKRREYQRRYMKAYRQQKRLKRVEGAAA